MTAAKPGSLAEALAALQAAMPAVGKHSTADVRKEGKKLYDYHYAPGEAITPVLYPLMSALGLSYTAMPGWHYGNDVHRFVLHYELLHSSGESRQGDYPLPDPDRYGPQDLGKAITYARRYALCALVGLFPGGDDNDDNDANGIQQAPRTDAAKPSQRQARAAEERARHDRAGHDPAKVTRTRPTAPEDDIWTQDAPVTGERAAAMRGTITDPEDKPGSILPGQHRALERLLSMLGPDFADRDTQHELVGAWAGVPGLASLSDLSVAGAMDAIKAAQNAVDDQKAKARA